MNFILIRTPELEAHNGASLVGARAVRALEVHKIQSGVRYKVVIEGRGIAWARVTQVSSALVGFELEGVEQVQLPLELHCVVGLSRPQTVKKVLELCASLGITGIHFVATENGERSYQDSTVFETAQLEEHLIRGIEQSGSILLPKVAVHSHLIKLLSDLFPKKAREDFSPSENRIFADTHAAIEHTLAVVSMRAAVPLWVVVGPEAGWSEAERTEFLGRGFQAISLGREMLRVEHALAMVLGQARLRLSFS